MASGRGGGTDRGEQVAATASERHPHEPKIAPVLCPHGVDLTQACYCKECDDADGTTEAVAALGRIGSAAQSRDERRVVPYAVGICMASVCAVADADGDEVARELNALHPTGIASAWAVSDESFADGSLNPSPCNDEPDARRHWLLEC